MTGPTISSEIFKVSIGQFVVLLLCVGHVCCNTWLCVVFMCCRGYASRWRCCDVVILCSLIDAGSH